MNDRTRLGRVFFGFFLMMICLPGFAQTGIEARHVIMLHPGFDAVWGTYMFGVRNEGANPEKFKGYLSLPKETIDFQAQEGLTQEELISGGPDGLMFEKEFPAGLTLISIGFKIPGNFGHASLTIAPRVDLEQFSLVTKKGALTLSSTSELFGESSNTVVSEEEFTAISSKGPIKSGQSAIISVGNVPEGRGRLWLAGGIIGAILITVSIAMTLKTLASSRPPEKVEVT